MNELRLGLFAAPTTQQRNEIELLCKKGMSDSYVSCYIQAPLQSVTAIATAMFDVPAEPIRGFFTAAACVFDGEFSDAALTFSLGIVAGGRSLVQIVVIVGSVAFGVFFPSFVYSALLEVNREQAKALEAQIQGLQNEEENGRSNSQQELENQINDLQKRFEESVQEKTQVENRLNDLQTRFDSSMQEKTQVENRLNDLQTRFESSAREKTQVEKELESIKRKNLEANNNNNNNKEVEELRKNLENQIKENKKLTREINQKSDTIKNIEIGNKQTIQKLESNRKTIEEGRKKITEQSNRIRDLEASLKQQQTAKSTD